MKIKDTYKVMKVVNNYVLIDTSSVNSSIIKLNETSKEIVELLIKGETKDSIIKHILDTYNIDEETISKDYDLLIESLKKAYVLDD